MRFFAGVVKKVGIVHHYRAVIPGPFLGQRVRTARAAGDHH
jgi:hypothetical protein